MGLARLGEGVIAAPGRRTRGKPGQARRATRGGNATSRGTCAGREPTGRAGPPPKPRPPAGGTVGALPGCSLRGWKCVSSPLAQEACGHAPASFEAASPADRVTGQLGAGLALARGLRWRAHSSSLRSCDTHLHARRRNMTFRAHRPPGWLVGRGQRERNRMMQLTNRRVRLAEVPSERAVGVGYGCVAPGRGSREGG